MLGLRGSSAAAEEAAVARDLAILAEVLPSEPRARLHLTHLSVPARSTSSAGPRQRACL